MSDDPPDDPPDSLADDAPIEESIPIPPDALSPDTLLNLIEEFVTRHGTDLADAADKIAQVRALLSAGRVEIVYDPNTQSCNILERK